MWRTLGVPVLASFGLFALMAAACGAQGRDGKTAYSSMAPIQQYLMERGEEIALARSAAPPSIASDAEVILLEKHGYESAVPGKNGFVCVVQRSWTAGVDDPEFWNPKVRAPICYNAAAAKSYLVLMIKRTELTLAGRSKEQVAEAIKAAIEKKELRGMEPGAMCYMLSKQGHLSDRDGHWHPHLMFFVSLAEPSSWGANLAGSPVIAAKDDLDRLTVFLVPVGKWSDGTPDVGH